MRPPPQAVAALLAQARQQQQRGDGEAAERAYRDVLRLSPNHPGASYQLGLLHFAAGRLREAQRAFERLARAHPGEAGVHFALGKLYGRQGDAAKSIFHLSRALALQPGALEPYLELIAAHGNAGRVDEARRIADQAEQRFPGRYEIPTQLGVACLAAGQAAAARALLDTAAARNPDSALVQHNLGRVADDQRDTATALAAYRRAHALDPPLEPAAFNLSDMELRTGDVAAAVARFDALLARNPSDTTTASARVMAAQYEPGITAAKLFELHRVWDRAFGPSPPRPRAAAAPRRLRIGLVSADLLQHPVGYFTIGAMERLDRDRFELLAYADRDTDDPICRRFKHAVGAWHVVTGMPDPEIAAMVGRDRIDILIDLAGHTRDNRLGVFARRPAPLQLSWAGYVGTTGLSAMDGLIADRFHVPPGEEPYYVERIIRLPDGYICFDPPAEAPEVTELPCASGAPLVFAGFHHPPKINRGVTQLWARVLREQPGSSIRFAYAGYELPEVQARIRGWFAEAGVDGDRLVFLGRVPRTELLRQYGEVDLALDPFPYSGGVTTCEALWMGVPVVTLPGATFAGRHSLSHLSVVGLTETVAADADDYVAIVRRLAADRSRLAALRKGLRQRVAASPLCDADRFAANLQTALLKFRASRLAEGHAG